MYLNDEPVTRQEEEAMERLAQRCANERKPTHMDKLCATRSAFHLHLGTSLALLHDVLILKQTPDMIRSNLQSAKESIDEALARVEGGAA